MRIGPIEYIYVQSTSLCNLNCNYCYLSEAERKQANNFPLDAIEPVFTKLFMSPFASEEKRIGIVWHIGEPLLLPVSYYQQFIQKVQEVLKTIPNKRLSVDFGLQTNGVNINDEWCDFFKTYDIQLGLSCDGPSAIQDKHRINWNKIGTSNKVTQAIKTLQARGIDFNILATITPETLQDPRGFFSYFVEHNIDKVGLNFVRKVAAQEQSFLENNLQKCRNFLEDLFTLYLEERLKNPTQHLRIQNFENMLYYLQFNNQDRVLFNRLTIPLSTISIDHQGNVSTFDPQLLSTPNAHYEGQDFLLGNLLTGDLDQMIHSSKFQAIHDDIQAGLTQCQTECEYFDCCNACLPASKYGEHRTFRTTETTQCRVTVQMVADTILKDLQQRLSAESKLKSLKLACC